MWGDNHQLRLGEFVASVITEPEAKSRYITKPVSCGMCAFRTQLHFFPAQFEKRRGAHQYSKTNTKKREKESCGRSYEVMIGHGHCTEDKWDKHAKNMTRATTGSITDVHGNIGPNRRTLYLYHVLQGWFLPFFSSPSPFCSPTDQAYVL